MERDKSTSLESDVYFLIQKFLSSGLLKRTLMVFNEELEENNILPRRIDWEGNEHERTVEDMVNQFPNIRPDYLLHLCSLASKSFDNSFASTSRSFLSFRPNLCDENGILTNFKQYFNHATRRHSAPVQTLNVSLNIVNSIRGREVSGPLSRHRTITPKLYSALQIQRITIGHLSAVYCLLFDHSGKYIMTGADDLLIKLWSACTGRLIAVFRGASSEITDIAVNSENTLLAAGSIDRILRVWSVQTGAPVAVLTGHSGMITSVNFCPTACWGVRYLISTSTDGSIAFWMYTYESGIKAEFRRNPIMYQEKIRPGQSQMICSSFSPGGTFLATGSADHHVRVYYMKGDEGPHRILEMEAHSDRVDSIQWAHAGLRFLSGSKDGMAIIWWFERQQWKSIHLQMSTRLPSAQNAAETDTKRLKVTMVCWNKTDNYVVTAVSDCTLKTWNSSGGQLDKVLTGHTDEIYVLEAHPHDDDVILSAGHDGQLIVWNILKGEIVFKFLNTIEGQGFGALFDVKWSPDGSVIAGCDSHGHILLFGFGNGSPYFQKLPQELFFHTDYRPLVRDSGHYVLDEQTQVPPHLMPPPFLVDIDGNPYPPMLQRLVPGRESCDAEQLVPNIVIGNEGTQEVIQDIPQNHVADLENIDVDDISIPSSFRQGRRYSNRDHERIRQSTGDWQSDPTFEWKRNVLVQPLRKSVLERAKEIRECLKNVEIEEYQKQLRQRPHMISINAPNNLRKKEDKKKKKAMYVTRAVRNQYEYKEDEPESSGNYSESSESSDWVAEEEEERTRKERPKRSNRRKVKIQEESDQEEEEEEDDDDDEEDSDDFDHDQPSTSKNHVNRRKEPNPNKTKENNSIKHNKDKENHINKSREGRSNHVSKSSEKQNKIKESLLGKANLVIRLSKTTADNAYTAAQSTSNNTNPKPKLKLTDQYRLSEWLSETRPRKSPYYPQLGDEIVYFMQGHQLYLNAVEMKKIYEISTKDLPWNKMQIRDHEFVKVIGIQYEIKPPRLCFLKLGILDDEGRLTGKGFIVKYHDMPDVLDFFVLKQMYITAMSRNWQTNDKCMIDDEWWIGQIMNKSPASENFPDSSFLCYEIKWTNGELERMSPWDMETIDPERIPEDVSLSMPVTQDELASILYKTAECDWPSDDLDSITQNVVSGLTKVMELAIAEPFLVPVDINVYPEYAMFIEYPIDLSTIKARFENRFYRRLIAAQFDIRYLALNAEKFNEKHSAIVKQSRIITDLCLRLVKNCTDSVDVPTLYHRIVDAYDSGASEEDIDVPPSTSKNLRVSVKNKRINRPIYDWKGESLKLVEALWDNPDSEPFREPVNPVLYHDYHRIVQNPMDLGTVREKVKNNEYELPQQFCIDMRLIFQNSWQYTPDKKTRIYEMTVRLSNLFEDRMTEIMSNWKSSRRRKNGRKTNGTDSDISISQSTSSSSPSSNEEEEVLSKLVSTQAPISDDDDTPLNILYSRTNTESDNTSQSTLDKALAAKTNDDSEEEYRPRAGRSRHVTTSEDDLDVSASSSEEETGDRRNNLRRRHVRKKVQQRDSSESDRDSSRVNKRVKKNSDSEGSGGRTTLGVNHDGGFLTNVSSRGRVRKLTERAKALFNRR